MQVQLVGNWVDASGVDAAIGRAGNPYERRAEGMVISIPTGCSLLVDAAIRLLAYSNQFAAHGIPVQLVF